jgi:hypothetical protein
MEKHSNTKKHKKNNNTNNNNTNNNNTNNNNINKKEFKETIDELLFQDEINMFLSHLI